MTRTIALVRRVFLGGDATARLTAALVEARAAGAGLAVLPELPLDPWFPATRGARDGDAEAPGGWRHQAFASAARAAGVAVLGGAVVRDPETGRRHNTALLYDAAGTLVGVTRKAHLPDEEGWREADHYEPGDDPPSVQRVAETEIGVQICSDANRPAGTAALAAMGAEVVAVPRATEVSTFDRWRLVLRASALTSCVWVLSVNRPGVEAGVPLGGPSLAVAPDGEVVVESNEPLALVELDPARLAQARKGYPGYLEVRPDLYAEAWRRAGQTVTGS